MPSVKSAFRIAIGERGLLIAINLISYVIIARLVSPEDVGIFSVTSAFVAMLAIIRDFGTGYYIATTKELTQEKLSTAFTFSFLIGFAVFLVVQAISYPVGIYFDDERVTNLLRLIAFNSLVLPVTGCLMTSMRRRFLFGRVFWINLTGSLSGALLTIGLGYLKYGVYALALGVAANYFVSALMAYLLKPHDLKLGISLQGWREVFSFGGKNSLIGFTQQASNSILEVIVGKYLGFVEAGFLSRALGVVNLFNRDFSEAVRSVVIHSFSRNVREGRDVEQAHQQYLTNYSCFGFFYFSFVFAFAEESIYLLAGDQWLNAVPYLKFFAVMGAIMTLYQFLPLKAMALGNMDDVLKASLVVEPIKFLIGVVAIFSFRSPNWFAASSILSCLVVAVVYWYKFGLIEGRLPTGLVRSVIKGIFPALMAVIFSRLIVDFLLNNIPIIGLGYGGFIGGLFALILYIILLILIRHPLISAINFRRA